MVAGQNNSPSFPHPFNQRRWKPPPAAPNQFFNIILRTVHPHILAAPIQGIVRHSVRLRVSSIFKRSFLLSTATPRLPTTLHVCPTFQVLIAIFLSSLQRKAPVLVLSAWALSSHAKKRVVMLLFCSHVNLSEYKAGFRGLFRIDSAAGGIERRNMSSL
jgi:hypothetical protein